MERTLSANYPVLKQNKHVIEYVRKKNTVIRFLSVHSIYLSLRASRIDVQCCIFRPWCYTNVFKNKCMTHEKEVAQIIIKVATFL